MVIGGKKKKVLEWIGYALPLEYLSIWKKLIPSKLCTSGP